MAEGCARGRMNTLTKNEASADKWRRDALEDKTSGREPGKIETWKRNIRMKCFKKYHASEIESEKDTTVQNEMLCCAHSKTSQELLLEGRHRTKLHELLPEVQELHVGLDSLLEATRGGNSPTVSETYGTRASECHHYFHMN